MYYMGNEWWKVGKSGEKWKKNGSGATKNPDEVSCHVYGRVQSFD